MKVFLFPGQGGQFAGMGAHLFRKYPAMIREANDILGYDIVSLCEEDMGLRLSETQYTQPAIYIVSALAYLNEVEDNGEPNVLMGHSLGEFAALYAAGAFSFETGLRLVKKRAELTCDIKSGRMAALIGMTMDEVVEILNAHQLTDIDIANYNSEKQIIISGLHADIDTAEKVFKCNNIKLYLDLNVGGPFHSRYMKPAAEKFGEYLAGIQFNPLRKKVISNVTAQAYEDDDIAALIEKNLVSTVHWYESISRVMQLSDDIVFKEIGVGDTLIGMLSFIRNTPMDLFSQ
ncbi:ACP S-malonyltransferase [Chitinophaga sp. Mgbs1]|uniref:Malonyl CoA-acyl carrier protein transacylase n=1 Tax=Chitinophaga solisilvae TaxID=1233460 RepID=A0A3S1D2M8_9BACT|nr:ACP S-malonyltransferase [Chitinophaga solisilvae]